jgi:acyl-CoA reductase-like NAD-dependent aldehyde dehydrogenase
MAELSIFNPATGRVIGHERVAAPADVKRAYAAARAAQPAWAETTLRHRLSAIAEFKRLLADDIDAVALTLTREMGKPIAQARSEVKGTLGRLDFFLAQAPKALKPETVWNDAASATREVITHDPLGVVANISAWNYPLYVGGNAFIPALLAGNAVLYKPSEYATRTGLHLARLLHASGVPADIFIPVIGEGATGAALAAQPVDGIFFTGSSATGRRIARAAAGQMIRLQFELGGKDPVYVCEDVDPASAAAATADGAFYNAGQSCCAVERLYVHRSIHAAFVEAFVAEVRRFVVGDPEDEKTYLGPLARRVQLEVLERQVADAKAKGGRVLCGGKRLKGKGNFFAPTVVADATHAMALMRDESFGPVIGIMPVDTDAEAVRLMNDTDYGLTAGVYTPNERRARSILAKVRSGSAYWNCCDRVSPRLPWTGVGASGLGVTLSTYGIQTFARPRAWHLRKS